MALIAASDTPKIWKVASLQLIGICLPRDSLISFLFNRSNELLEQLDSWLKKLFSIPKWYPEIIVLNVNIIIKIIKILSSLL